jgi:hypothetical protein
VTGLNKIQGDFNDLENHRPARVRFKAPCVYVEWKTPNAPSKPTQGRPFSGAVLDTGAQMTVIGMEQAKGYCKESGKMFSLLPSRSRFKFGASSERSLGKISIEIPTPGSPIHINCDVVKSDVPLLIGLDILDKYGLNVLSVEGLLQSTTEHWTIPMQRLWGHIYLQWDPGIQLFYTRAELTKIHRHFHHPSTEKLVNLLKRATPGDLPKETRAQLDGIQQACETCTRFSPRPQHFQVTIDPDRIVFNKEIIMDLMYLESKPVLHVIDRGTTFSSAKFLYSSDRITVWNTFVQCWTSMYVGFPDSILTDQGSVFQSEDWRNACLGAGIHLRSTGIESHNSLGVGERFHQPLRRLFQKISSEYNRLDPETILSISTKTMNDLAGPEGLVPSFLVFGVVPRWTTSLPLPENSARLTAIQVARAEYEHIVAKMKLATALNRNVPAAADYCFNVGDSIYVYRETQKQWTGPHKVSRIEDKGVWIESKDKTPDKQFNISQCRPAPMEVVDTNSDPHSTLHSVVIGKRDPRARLFDQAKRDEISGLFEKGTFRIVCRDEVNKDHKGMQPNILPSRFVLAIKHEDDGNERLKARLVVGGHRDVDKESMLHDTATVRHVYIRLLVALATLFGYPVWTIDVDQAYLQAAEPLMRKIYIIPQEGIELRQNELLQVLKPLYGIAESGDYWGETVRSHHLKDLKLIGCKGDLATFYKNVENRFSGASSTYVDDILRTGDHVFENSMLLTGEMFKLKRPKFDNFRFAGCEVTTSGRTRRIHQKSYIQRLKLLPKNATFSDFRSRRAQFAWIVNTRPDISAVSSQCSSVTDATYGREWILVLNDAMKYLQQSPSICLCYPKLDLKTLCIVVYTDSSFANNDDLSTQIRHIAVLADGSESCCVLSYSSRKSRRVVRSSLAGETLAMSEGFDTAFILRHDLQEMTGLDIQLLIMTDSKSLFDIITRRQHTTEKRLMVDIAAIREGFSRREIANVGLIKSEDNPADGLTKRGFCRALYQLLNTNKIQAPVLQYIVEKRATAADQTTHQFA